MISTKQLFENKPFVQVLKKIKDVFNFDVSYMDLKISNQPVYTDGRINIKMNPLEYAGCWTKNKTIQIGDSKHLVKVMKFYGVNNMTVEQFTKLIIGHELGHEIYKNLLNDKEKSYYKTKLKTFRTVYIDTVKDINKLDEEKFCEYVASKVNNYGGIFSC